MINVTYPRGNVIRVSLGDQQGLHVTTLYAHNEHLKFILVLVDSLILILVLIVHNLKQKPVNVSSNLFAVAVGIKQKDLVNTMVAKV